MQNKSKRENELTEEYKVLLLKKREAKDEQERGNLEKQLFEKYQEILIERSGGDKNIGRFNSF